MKKILILTFMLMIFGLKSNAQCPANDSTSMGPGTSSDVFYSLRDHVVSTVFNTNWHMAFSVQATDYANNNPANAVAIRVNSGGNGTVLKKLNGASASNWRTIDTTGLYALPQLLDSDSTWNLSAFTKGYPVTSDPSNFIWGTYNQITHHVTGNSVFVLYNPAAGWYKKVFIKECSFDTLWNFVISNIDNSDSGNIRFLKKSYPDKMFVYYNALTKQLIDREPVKTAWDLVWTKYVTYVTSPQGNGFYPVAGVLSNPKVTVEQNTGKKCNEVWLGNRTSKLDPRISAIGHDWKTFTGTAYRIADTFVYFVKGQDGKTYKMTFKGFAGGPLGKSTFNFYEATTGIHKIDTRNFTIYPNPSTGLVSIEADVDINTINVIDMQGKTVFSGSDTGLINISGLSKGIYVIIVDTNEGVYYQQIIRE